MVQDGRVGDALQLAERGRQVHKGAHDDQHQRKDRREEEAAVDRRHPAAVLLSRGHEEDPSHRGQDADRRDDQRKDKARRPERRLAEDQRGHQGDGVGLEQVGRHSGAVTDVVTHVVGDRRCVARVVLRDALLHLADQVRTDIGRLSENAAADAHEHGEQSGAESEALEHARRVGLVDQHDGGRPEQAEADGKHPGHAAGTESDPHSVPLAGLAGGGRDPDIAADGQRHAREPGQGREQGADQEEDRPAPSHRARIGRQHEQHEEDHDDEHAEGPELPPQVGSRALLDGLGDLLHLGCACARGEHLPDQPGGHRQCQHGDDRHDRDPGHVRAGHGGRSVGESGTEPCHPSSSAGKSKPSRAGRVGGAQRTAG